MFFFMLLLTPAAATLFHDAMLRRHCCRYALLDYALVSCCRHYFMPAAAGYDMFSLRLR